MSQRPMPLRGHLRSVDEGHAGRQTSLIAALNARRVGDQLLTARVAFARDRRAATAWIRFRSDAQEVLLAPLLVGGELVRLGAQEGAADAAVAARLLGDIEPLVVALESALGGDLHPEGLAAAAPDDSLLLRLDVHCPRGAIQHRLLAAVPLDGAKAIPLLPPAVPDALSALRVSWTGRMDAPAIPAASLRRVGVGDLLLLGTGPLCARISIPGRRGLLSGRLDPAKGCMTLHDDIVQGPAGIAPTGEPAALPAAGDQAVDWNTLKVPATVEIDGGTLAATDIAGLAAGSVLPLPVTGGLLGVRVVAGGMTIGQGELVAIGQGFGVLFTSVVGATGDDTDDTSAGD